MLGMPSLLSRSERSLLGREPVRNAADVAVADARIADADRTSRGPNPSTGVERFLAHLLEDLQGTSPGRHGGHPARSVCRSARAAHPFGMNRRDFMGAILAAAAVQGLGGPASRAAESSVPRRSLGRTGESVSIVGLGGFHIGKQQDAAESVRIIRAAVDGGITFLDNSWDYNAGESERRMGTALRDGYRERVFLMTKFDGRDAKSARDQMNESLRRLRTDHVDLLQFHEIIRPTDPERIFAKGGAIEAALAARKAGKARFLGFTGHKSPEIHLAMPILEQALRLARGFQPLSDAERRALERKAAAVAANGEFEAYKSSHHFDSTYEHPEWLG
jgi:hypothetical protein